MSRRELARARVLVASFHVHHPRGRFAVLVTDGVDGIAITGARLIALEQVAGSASGMLVAGNPPDVLDAAVLPHLMRSLSSERWGPLAYLACGLRILGPLAELELQLDQHELVLVSRTMGERDSNGTAHSARGGGLAISRRVLGSTGGPGADRVLAAWPGFFPGGVGAVHDWFDGIPATGEDVGVLEDTCYGLDPWAPSGSRVESGPDGLRVERRPVRVFDFSSLDPETLVEPDMASTDARPPFPAALAELCRLHTQELLAAGYAEDARRPSRYAKLRDGTSVTPIMRKLMLEGIGDGRLVESPFTELGREAFFRYLDEPAERGAAAGLTRLHLEVWNTRPDVQSAFPDLDGSDGPRFVSWLQMHAHEDHELPERLLPSAPERHLAAVRELDAREPLWGVNVVGRFRSEEEMARLLIAGLDARAVPALPVRSERASAFGGDPKFFCCALEQAPYPMSIVCLTPDRFAPFARAAGGAFFEGRHTVALWCSEVRVSPDAWTGALEHIDEVWVGSQYVYDAIALTCPVPVVKVTLPVVLPPVPQRGRAELGLPEDGFLFLDLHNYRAPVARKNPLGLVEAFKRAFRPGSGAKLVLKSINAESMIEDYERVMSAAGDHPDITLIDGFVSAGEKSAMLAACDCYVSLHRSAGFGLTMAQAMLLGKPVIATRYGGNLEFMSESNSYLVDCKQIAVAENTHCDAVGAVWADPDLDEAAGLMRLAFSEPTQARAKGQLARRDVAARHGPQAAGEQIEACLRASYEQLVRNGPRSLNFAHRPRLDHAQPPASISGEPIAHGRRIGSALNGFVRRTADALLRPLLSRQRAIDSLMQASLDRMEERLYEVANDLQSRQQAVFAEALAVNRALGADARSTDVTVEALARDLEHHLAQHRATPFIGEGRGFSAWSDPVAGPVVGYRSERQIPLERRYIEFEATFRGPEDLVRKILRAYLPLLAGHGPVLDLGCGRGELLDLLREADIPASGVDLDAAMVEHSRIKGHDVALGDGIEHLRSMRPGSLGAVVAIEVVEHLAFERMMEFLELARSRLRGDGLLLFETVNPHALDAMKAFWVDPTHHHPVFPEVALELCRLSGFQEAVWFYPTGKGRFEQDRDSQPMYAIVARAS